MRDESEPKKRTLKGYLFELVLQVLLQKNGFRPVCPADEPESRVRETREGFVEVKGRGCWHQIDCFFDYEHMIPFTYPIRMIGEAKFYNKRLSKQHVRSLIGVLKDIQENYYAEEEKTIDECVQRRTEIGVFFAVNGFCDEAEKLAYAHGIKTVSYRNHPLMREIGDAIDSLVEDELSVSCMSDGNWRGFREAFLRYLYDGRMYIQIKKHVLENNSINRLYNIIAGINTSFFGTTGTGVILHFLGRETFPEELFIESDRAKCCIYSQRENRQEKGELWLEFTDDQARRKFFFTRPKALSIAEIFGSDRTLNEKERLFHDLKVNQIINGLSRNLILQIDPQCLKHAQW